MSEPRQETQEFWRHAAFRELGLLKARFRKHRYDRHTHDGYVIALITEGCERVRVGRRGAGSGRLGARRQSGGVA